MAEAPPMWFFCSFFFFFFRQRASGAGVVRKLRKWGFTSLRMTAFMTAQVVNLINNSFMNN